MSDSMPMDHSMHDPNAIYNLADTDDAPSITMQVTSDQQGWAIAIETKNFTFYTPEADMAPHQDGQGHGHLYLNGLKLQRLYSATTRIGELPGGSHLISVTLNTNDHRAYQVAGKPVAAAVEVRVP